MKRDFARSQLGLLAAVSAIAICSSTTAFAQDNSGTSATNAQPAPTAGDTVAQPTPADSAAPNAASGEQEIVVTGIRASLERSIAIKRNSSGVVDAISAEDIGKFPDTNLAESLQRITGVSIDRVNGEGSKVTVRGLGPGYNLVTLNGRTLAASDLGVVGGDGNADGGTGGTRSFDFDNLASEGVKTLEVYKTGRAAVPSGGIGATVNVVTRRPLDSGHAGFTGSLGVKANYDTSVNDCISCGSKVTPEVSGLLSWSDDNQMFGISLFGSYQKRNFSTAQSGGNAWNVVPYSQFLTGGYVNGSTVIHNAPTNPDQLVGIPNDSRSDFSEDSRERINAYGVLQFKPSDSFVLTADVLFAQNRQSERRTDSGNWFNRPFDEVTFDGNKTVDTAVFLHETLAPTKDGPGSENQYRATKARLEDYGLNARWNLSDSFTVSLDGHYSKASTKPDDPLGHSSTLLAVAGYGIHSHSVDYSGEVPVQVFDFQDTSANPLTPFRQGNRNGVMDVGDIGSQVARSYTTTQSQTLKEGRADFGWDLGGGSRLDFGTDYRDSKVRATQISTYQPLGDWGVANPGDVEAVAPGQLHAFCLPCKFHSFNLHATGNALTAFRFQDVTDAWSLLSAHYAANGVSTSFQDNGVREKIWSVYGQLTWDGELAGRHAQLVAGVRYERTSSTSVSFQNLPQDVRWDADNDFTVIQSANSQALADSNHYNNLLPSMDFRWDLSHSTVARFSFSKTIARTQYSNLYSATTVGGPNRPTALGGVPTANGGNPRLIPLVSDNFDISVEHYYHSSNYISAGFFAKRVQNFVGNGLTTQSLFGLRDPSSAAAGTRSGAAATALSGLGAGLTDVNLFTMTALIDQLGSVAAATAQFSAHYNNTTPNALDQAFVDTVLTAYNVSGNSSDPLYQFSVTRPINNKSADIWGFEVAGQHFFGRTGFGVAAAYTYARSNVGIDNGADPSVDQFAIVGLSDTVNASLIYDKAGLSARLTYNWRGKFLAQLNRDNYHNPVYTEPFGQLDLNISYDITPNVAVSFEGINLTNESIRQHERTWHEVIFAQDLQRRFLLGLRVRM